MLRHIDACFEGGELALVTGRTGAGKSTLMHILAGLIRPTRGRVLADGRPVSRWNSRHRDAWRRGVGIVFQQLCLLEELTLLENVMLPLVPRISSVSTLRRRGMEMLTALDLECCSGERPATLSGGERQRVALARALVANPDFILADEPTAFQDSDGVSRIMALLEMHAATGAVVIVCSHDVRLWQERQFEARYHLTEGRLTGEGGAQAFTLAVKSLGPGEGE